MIAILMVFSLFAEQSDLPPLPDWSTMGTLRYRQEQEVTPPMTQFVADEVAEGLCAWPRQPDGHYALTLDIAVWISADGNIRATVPHAINCPTVEQYGAGLVSAFARDNLVPRAAQPDQWYRTSLTFTWTR
jgi:hypothetical protein